MPKSWRFWPFLLALLLADCSTKRIAVERLAPAYTPHDVVGETVRFTLAYNPGAAMSLSLGPFSRPGFSLIALVAFGVILRLYRAADPDDGTRLLGLALLGGGALGNLLDRILSPLGVVDFIDIGVGDTRFWTFNVADVGITLGAALLALSFLRASAVLPSPPPARPTS